jgi:hypothetical protein
LRIAKFFLKYPRYQPSRLRPPGAGAFFDYVASVANRQCPKLKSSSIAGRWHKGAPVEAAPVEPTEEVKA